MLLIQLKTKYEKPESQAKKETKTGDKDMRVGREIGKETFEAKHRTKRNASSSSREEIRIKSLYMVRKQNINLYRTPIKGCSRVIHFRRSLSRRSMHRTHVWQPFSRYLSKQIKQRKQNIGSQHESRIKTKRIEYLLSNVVESEGSTGLPSMLSTGFGSPHTHRIKSPSKATITPVHSGKRKEDKKEEEKSK